MSGKVVDEPLKDRHSVPMDPMEGAVIKAAREAWGKQEPLIDQLTEEGLGWSKQSSGVRALSRLEAGHGMRDKRRYRRILEIIGLADDPPLILLARAMTKTAAELNEVREELSRIRLAVLGLVPSARLREVGMDEADVATALRRVVGGTDRP